MGPCASEQSDLWFVQPPSSFKNVTQDHETTLFCQGQSIEKMSLIEKIVGCVLGSAVVSISLVPAAQAAANLAINDETQLVVQTPQGFSYVSAGSSSVLNVQTDGFVFCANVYPDLPPTTTAVTFAPSHTRWTLPTAIDVQSITYASGVLRVNKALSGLSTESTLVCQTRGAQGDISRPFSAYSEWLFRDGMESQLSAAVQYANMVNWVPPAGFSWAQTGAWSQVPTDACNFDRTSADMPLVPENSLCAAATGVGTNGTRSATMWTQISGSSFIYLARIDGRLGAQVLGPNANFQVTDWSNQQVQSSTNSVDTAIGDGFDSTYLSAGGSYCLLTNLPTTLTPTVCSGAPVSGTLNGLLKTKFTLSLSFPVAPATSFYVAVVRPIIGVAPTTPVAAIAVMADPGTVRHDAGDSFTGDDVVFGFPTSAGTFPWMGN